MNVDYINPFIQGSQNILDHICGEKPILGKLFLKEYPLKVDEVSIIVGTKGDILGNIVYTMNMKVACGIASKMMFGMPIDTMDEMSQSAIAELANMISGNVATIFSEKGKSVDITPPSFKLKPTNSDFPFVGASSKVMCIPLNFVNGDTFELDIVLQ